MNVIILACMLVYFFLLFHIKDCEVSVSLILFVSLLPSSTEEDLRGNSHFSHFSHLLSLSSHFSSHLLSPPLSAEEPQCLLLTFSYHLSPFHHHHYLPLLSVIYSRLPISPLLSHHLSVSVSSVFSLSCRQQVSSAPPAHLHTSLSRYIISISCSLLRHNSCYACQRGHLIFMRSQHCRKTFDHRT